MQIIPAIDLKAGRCVRLVQGRMEQDTVYDDDPAAPARRFAAAGADKLHVVDLDGAFKGKSLNPQAVAAIRAAYPGVIELGGGIRDMDGVDAWIEAGVDQLILGTVAQKRPQIVREATTAYPGKIIVGIDAMNGMVAINGWKDVTKTKAIALARHMEDMDAAAIIYTDIARDGMLQGPNIEQIVEMARALTIPVIASGGVSCLDDIRALLAVADEGIEGVIVGKAIYEGKVDLAQAIALTKG